MTTTTFSTAYNHRTFRVEVHADGCNHLGRGHYESVSTDPGTDAPEVAQRIADRNDGIVVEVAPCARKRNDRKVYASEWTAREIGLAL